MSSDDPRTVAQTPGSGGPVPPPAPDADRPDLPGYDVLHELGRGGMGVVYLARQRGLNRDVAVKVLPATAVSKATLARFWAEAEVMAEVRHPNVVQVIELGEHAGRPFMAMEYVPGGSLADRLKGEVRLAPADAARVLAAVARGVAAAHDLGVVHRDLKPDNVLMDGDVPKVADFGIAKRKAHDLTQTNAMMGTPAYMAPELAASRAKYVGPAADVWSLGVMLYELLAGRRPFDGDSVFDVLAKIATEDPPALRTVASGVPRDLQTIVAKCLTREPEQRYPTAAGLADDLERYGRGEPIAARPVGPAERAARWVRRKPTAAAAYGLSALAAALAVVVFVVFGFWREAETERGAAVEARKDAEGARDLADGLRKIADAGRVEEARLRGVAERATEGEKRARETLAVFEYGAAIRLAYQAWRDKDYVNARRILDGADPRLRGWEWHHVHRLCHGSLVTIPGYSALAPSDVLSPDGRRVVTRSADGQIRSARVWDTATGKELATLTGHTGVINSAVFGPHGARVLTASEDRTVRVWDAATGKELVALRHADKGQIDPAKFGLWAKFSPDGRHVLTYVSDRDSRALIVRLWDAAAGNELATFQDAGTDRRLSVEFTPDGRVVTWGTDDTVRVSDPANGKAVVTLSGHAGRVNWVTHSPDGHRLLTRGEDRTLRVWAADTGKELAKFNGIKDWPPPVFSPDGQRVAATAADETVRVWDASSGKELFAPEHKDARGGFVVVFSPDGQRVATTDGKTAHVWETATGKRLTTLGRADSEAATRMLSPAFSPDGRRVATVAVDHTVRVWDAETGVELAVFYGHETDVHWAVFSPDGRRVVSASLNDRTVRVWDATVGTTGATLTHGNDIRSAAFSPDGRRVLTTDSNRGTWLWDATTGAELDASARDVDSARFSPDGKRVVTTRASDDTVRVWDAATGDDLVALDGHAGADSARFSPDGRRVVTAGGTTARVWDAVSGKVLATLTGHTDRVWSADFSPDGTRVVTAGEKTARIWDAAGGKELATLDGYGDSDEFLYRPRTPVPAFSPDGRRVVATIKDRVARVWDATTGKRLVTLRHTDRGGVTSAAFSPDGRWVVTAGLDETARVWDAATGAELVTLKGHTSMVESANWSPDGRRVVTVGWDDTVRVWHAATGAELVTLKGHGVGDALRASFSASFSPDGTRILSVGADRTARVWDSSPLAYEFLPRPVAPAPRAVGR